MLFQLGLEALEQRPWYSRRTFFAVALMTILPSVTCPSPPMATTLPRRTDRIVVP